MFGDVAVLREAVDTGWIPSGSTVVDLGCGLGDAAAYLAERGMRVTGVDVSGSVIARARARYATVANLVFLVHDLSEPLALGPFDVLYDRGCFHGLSARSRRGYRHNVASWSRPGTRFLLLTRLGSPPDPQRLEAEIRALFEPPFVCRDVRAIPMFRADVRAKRDGLAFFLESHSASHRFLERKNV